MEAQDGFFLFCLTGSEMVYRRILNPGTTQPLVSPFILLYKAPIIEIFGNQLITSQEVDSKTCIARLF